MKALDEDEQLLLYRMKRCLQHWTRGDMIGWIKAEYIARLMLGRYFYAVTFIPGGPISADSFVMVDAPDHASARRFASELFDGYVDSVRVEYSFNPINFPGGIAGFYYTNESETTNDIGNIFTPDLPAEQRLEA